MKPTAWFAALAAMTASCNALAVGDVAQVTIIDCSTGAVLTPYLHHGEYWRKSADEVAAFTFTASPNSYAARTGRPANVGVIGVAVFRERQQPQVFQPPVPAEPLSYREQSTPAPIAGVPEQSALPSPSPAPSPSLAPVANPFPASPQQQYVPDPPPGVRGDSL